MQDIYNQQFNKPIQSDTSTVTLFSVDFDDPNVTLLQITNGLREIAQGDVKKQVAIYVSNSTTHTLDRDKSQALYCKINGMTAFIQSYSNLSVSFILRGNLGWEFLPILLQQSQVFFTNGTTVMLNNLQLNFIAFCLKNNTKLMQNVVENLSIYPIYTAIYDLTALNQLGFNILQYN